MSDPVSVGLTVDGIWAAIYLVIALNILIYVARLPNKRSYYFPFMGYAAAAAGFAFIVLFENAGVSEQAAFRASEFTFLIGPAPMIALQYYFILNFSTEKKNWFQKITLAAGIGYWLLLGITEAATGIAYVNPHSLGVITATGYTPPPQNAPWFNYLRTPVIPLFDVKLLWEYLALTLLSLYALLSFYRKTRSPVVKSQIRFLCAGVLLDYTAVVYHMFIVQPQSPLYGAPDIQTPFYIVTLLVLLVGLTRHQFRKVAPTAETAAAIPQTYALEDARSYLSRDNDSAFAAFSELVRNGREGLCVTRIFPDDVRKTHGLQTTPIRWLAEEKREDAISATDLLGLSLTVKDFMRKAKRPVVMLQGVEYLARVNGFTPIVRLLDGLYETAGEKNGILLIPVSQNALEPREDAILVAETTPIPAPLVR